MTTTTANVPAVPGPEPELPDPTPAEPELPDPTPAEPEIAPQPADPPAPAAAQR